MVTNLKKNNNRRGRNLLLAFGALGLALVLIVLLVADIRMYKKRQVLTRQVEAMKGEIQNTKDSNASLKQGIANADNPAYIQKVAREELDLQKPGETVVSFVAVPDQPAPNIQKPTLWWQAWVGGAWNWLTGTRD